MVRSILKAQFYPITKRTSRSLESSMIGRPHSISAILNKKQILKKNFFYLYEVFSPCDIHGMVSLYLTHMFF